MRERDELYEPTSEALDVAELYHAILSTIAAEQPAPEKARYVRWVQPCCDSIPSREYTERAEMTNTGTGNAFI